MLLHVTSPGVIVSLVIPCHFQITIFICHHGPWVLAKCVVTHSYQLVAACCLYASSDRTEDLLFYHMKAKHVVLQVHVQHTRGVPRHICDCMKRI